MKILVIACICLAWCSCCLASSFDMGKCLDAIRQAESSGRDSCIGDGYKSRGAFQIQENTWVRYSKMNWKKYAHDPKESRIVASLIVSDIIKHCKKYHNEQFVVRPYAIVCMHYNAGINTNMAVNTWLNKTKNKVYKNSVNI